MRHFQRRDTHANGLANDLCPKCREAGNRRDLMRSERRPLRRLNWDLAANALINTLENGVEIPARDETPPEPKLCARYGCENQIPQDMNFCSAKCERDYKELVMYLGASRVEVKEKPVAVLAYQAAMAEVPSNNPMLRLMQRIVADRMLDVHHVLSGDLQWSKEQVTLFRTVLSALMDPRWAALAAASRDDPEAIKRQEVMRDVDDLSTQELQQLLRVVKAREVEGDPT